jgi:hypothetical protein
LGTTDPLPERLIRELGTRKEKKLVPKVTHCQVVAGTGHDKPRSGVWCLGPSSVIV